VLILQPFAEPLLPAPKTTLQVSGFQITICDWWVAPIEPRRNGGQANISGEKAALFLEGLAAKMDRFLASKQGVNIEELFEWVG
jgi:hypothetical protein